MHNTCYIVTVVMQETVVMLVCITVVMQVTVVIRAL